MATSKYITGPRKAAILLLALGEEAAAKVMLGLSEAEVQQVGFFMTRMSTVEQDELVAVLLEYNQRNANSEGSLNVVAGSDFVRNTLNKAFGADRTQDLMSNFKENSDENTLQSLRWLDPRTIAQFIANEHPQTVAIILAHMDSPDKMGQILKQLPESIQADVAYRIAVLESIPPGVINEIDEVLTHEMQTAGMFSAAKVGGIEAVAEALNSMEKAMETRILSAIEEANPDLADNIRELMFTFEDLVFVDTSGLQLLISQVAQKDLVIAMKTASEQIKDLIYKNMSQRQRTMIKDDVDNLGPVRMSEVELAQQRIVRLVKKYEEEGRVFITGRRGGDVLA